MATKDEIIEVTTNEGNVLNCELFDMVEYNNRYYALLVEEGHAEDDEPELMIYLRSSVPHLVKNIQKRGRECEQKIPLDYLQGINALYEDFIWNKYKGKVLVIDVDNMDFEHNPKEFGGIIDKIDAELFGLFSSRVNEKD